jgi:hypothetical protein
LILGLVGQNDVRRLEPSHTWASLNDMANVEDASTAPATGENAPINIKVSLEHACGEATAEVADADWINQVVTSQGDEVFFKIKRNTKLTKLRSAYANKVGKDLNSIRYVLYLTSLVAFGGEPLAPQTSFHVR